MLDPYPGKELLTSGDVMKLLSLRKTAWYALLRDEAAGFPKALVLQGRQAVAEGRSVGVSADPAARVECPF